MSRDELVAKARSLGVERPELMTRVELGDEIVRRTQSDPVAQQRARGWLGVARDLVASVVSTGLSMPDAAALIRGERAGLEFKGPSPVATVTLAEIYATQGHIERALNMLDEVLAREPEHAPAHALRERLRSDPRARRAEGGSARSPESEREPLVAEAPPIANVNIEVGPATSERPLDPEAAPAAAAEMVEAQAVAEAVAQLVERADAEVVTADATKSRATVDRSEEFEPVSLAPPLTDLPTHPHATAMDAGLAPVQPLAGGAAAPQEEEPEQERPAALDVPRAELDVPRAEPEPAEPELPRAELQPVPEEAHSIAPPEGTASDIAPTLAPVADPDAESEPILVIVHRSSGDPIVCWDVADVELAAQPLELQCHAFSASARGAERRTITLPVAARRGSAKLPGFTAATLIRAALGERSEGNFTPLVIASELTEQAGGLDVRFRPPLSSASSPTPGEQSLVAHFAV